MNTDQILTDRQIIEALNATNVATAIHTTEDAIIQAANDVMLKVWGKDKSVIGKSLADALPELRDQPFIDLFKKVWQEGITISGTNTPAILKIDGQLKTFYFDFEYKAIKNDSGQTYCILHTATDISEHYLSKQREQSLLEELSSMNEELAATNEELINSQITLQSLNANLLESERQLQFAIEAAELATWDYNPETGRFSGNNRLKEWFGLRPEQEIELYKATDNITMDDREKVINAIQHATHADSGGTFDLEYHIIHPATKKARFVRAKGKTQFNAAGIPLRMSGTLQDITEQKQKEQYKDDFISIASHELKTPITTLKASLQLLNKLKEKIDLVMVSTLIEQANKSMEKTSALVDDLLNASKVNSGQLELNKNVFSMVKMLKGCCGHIKAGGKHELVFEGDERLKVHADEHRIDQVVVNMVNNAVKYASNSKKIYLITENLGEHVKVSIKDNGPGVQPDKIPYLFDRYYRTDHSGVQFSGLGLGLYISAEIIRKHGGKIGVESVIGKGSTFWFTLPKYE